MLKNKIVVITGAGRGIGKTIALKLAQQGADIIVCDINEQAAADTVQEIKKIGRKSMAFKVDVSCFSDVENMVQKVLDNFTRIDILVNNAGITRDNLLIRMQEIDWDLVLKINLKGVFNCTKSVLRPMMKQRQGRIINVASVVGIMGNMGQANYAASKAGVIGFTKSIAKEVASRNINVNAIAPGFIKTDMTDNLTQEVKEALLAQIPFKRFGSVEDVANVVLFLASQMSEYLTGEVIRIDGGMAM
jgi:3-oxoacyl-[acyl-carrier protein] reductase